MTVTDARVGKLVCLGVSAEDAALLMTAGYDTPAKIKAAKDEDLLEVIESLDELSRWRPEES